MACGKCCSGRERTTSERDFSEICVIEIPATAVTGKTNKSTNARCMNATADFVKNLKNPPATVVGSPHDLCNLILQSSLASSAGNLIKKTMAC